MGKFKDRNELEVKKYTSKEIEELFNEYFKTRSEIVRNKLIEAHIPLVKTIANSYYKNIKKEDYEDVVSAGYEALGYLIERHDPSLGNFSSYAYISLKGIMEHEYNNTSNSVVVKKREEQRLIDRMVNDFEEKYGKKPSYETISKKTGIKLPRVYKIMNARKGAFDIDDYELIDKNNTLSVLDSLDADLIDEAINECLSEKQKKVIILRYGLNGEEKKTYAEISKMFGLTGEGVRLIEEKALRKLRLFFIRRARNFRKEDIVYHQKTNKVEKEFIPKKTDDYNDYYKDYEGYTEEEFEDRGIGFK